MQHKKPQDGEMEGLDQYKTLLQTKQDFAELVKDFTADEEDEDSSQESVNLEDTVKLQRKQLVEEEEEVVEGEGNAKLTKKEEQLVGTISWRHYYDYMMNGGKISAILVVILSVMGSAGRSGFEYFLSFWVDNSGTHPNGWFIGIMGMILFLYILSLSCRSLLFAHFSLTSSTVIHNETFDKILRAPMSFFDVTPLGRILNRFSNDMDKVDIELPSMFENWIMYSLNTAAVLVVIIIMMPWFVVALVPIFLAFTLVLNYFVKSSRELKRIEAISISPLVSHISATLQGLTTIRAYGSTNTFIQKNIERVDFNTAAMWAFDLTGRWSGYRFDVLGSIIVFVVSAMTMLLRSNLSPGISGMLITFSFQMVGSFQWAVRTYADTENNMAYYERLQEYNHTLQSEAPRITNVVPSPSWPDEGKIEFKNVEVRYRPDLPPVLKSASFTVRPREKVGIVGRTGAGKSTLTMALFRLIEPTGGAVMIDGIDISVIGLDNLRSKLAIIPQDPVLFLGNIRSNLDPFGFHSDSEIWGSLGKVHLASTVRELPGGLDYQISEGGENFSIGQRQLICIARALLRNSQILVLDEATASIDNLTDNLIQETIRNSFSHCTVLTIAHRLHTIIDSDRILVMDKGKVEEFDVPHILLQNPHSLFSQLVDETSPDSAKKLRAEAAEVYFSKVDKQ
eukprot:TRINITY_DN7137_c0_g1_i2.p1 TRINITY_DN7137_c0_g1~~TRINITY_DN7137_c0_g1_i2.p1  ORF type:complete len:679 (-),score=153.04 TRINITY_DN7137_c0_g1_i2:44-2080(-)